MTNSTDPVINAHSKSLGLEDLPSSVRSNLRAIALEFRAMGVELILFGSIAEGRAQSTSDLDLAYAGRITAEQERLLAQRIEGLPTIRPIDLVPFDSASDQMVEEIRSRGIFLADI